jgi:hypothetical protein
MKKIASLVGILTLALSLSSCVKLDLNLEINKDSTVSGTMIFALVDSLAAMGDSTQEEESPTDSFVSPTTKGVKVTEYKEDGYTGQKFTLDRVPFSEFGKDSSGESDFKVKRTGNKITVTGFLDLGSGEDSSSGSDWGDALAKSIMSSADLKISIKFPAKVLKSTGEISEDGKTVTWRPELGEKVDLTTTVELPTAKIGAAIGGLLALILLAGAGIFVLARRKKAATSLSQEAEGGQTEN